MLEVQAHQQLKHLLRGSAGHWEHELTLSRLVGRSLRRQDRTRIQLSAGSNDRWWLALMVPLALQSRHTVLVLDALQQQRLLQVERPRLMESGIRLSCWTGDVPPPGDQLWLLTTPQLVDLHRDGRLRPQDHLVIPAAETLASRLRLAMALQIDSTHWEQLRTAFPAAGEGLLELHERLSRQVASCGTGTDRDIAMPESSDAGAGSPAVAGFHTPTLVRPHGTGPGRPGPAGPAGMQRHCNGAGIFIRWSR